MCAILTTVDPEHAAEASNTELLSGQGDLPSSALDSISIVVSNTLRATKGHILVRVGAACTNERLRRWCSETHRAALPLDASIVELTTVTSSDKPNVEARTLGTLVRAIEYVDCNGVHRTISDSRHIQVMGHTIGLLGVITHITLELLPSGHTLLAHPEVDLCQAVPPPADMLADLPKALMPRDRTAAQRQDDLVAFEKASAQNYYAEYLWCARIAPKHDTTAAKASNERMRAFLRWAVVVLLNIARSSQLLKDLDKVTRLEAAGTELLASVSLPILYGPVEDVRLIQQSQRVDETGLAQASKTLDQGCTAPPSPPSVSDLARRTWWEAVLTLYQDTQLRSCFVPAVMLGMAASPPPARLVPLVGSGTSPIRVLTLQNEAEAWGPPTGRVIERLHAVSNADVGSFDQWPPRGREWNDDRIGSKLTADVLRSDCSSRMRDYVNALQAITKAHAWSLEQASQRSNSAEAEWLTDVMFFTSL